MKTWSYFGSLDKRSKVLCAHVAANRPVLFSCNITYEFYRCLVAGAYAYHTCTNAQARALSWRNSAQPSYRGLSAPSFQAKQRKSSCYDFKIERAHAGWAGRRSRLVAQLRSLVKWKTKSQLSYRRQSYHKNRHFLLEIGFLPAFWQVIPKHLAFDRVKIRNCGEIFWKASFGLSWLLWFGTKFWKKVTEKSATWIFTTLQRAW